MNEPTTACAQCNAATPLRKSWWKASPEGGLVALCHDCGKPIKPTTDDKRGYVTPVEGDFT